MSFMEKIKLNFKYFELIVNESENRTSGNWLFLMIQVATFWDQNQNNLSKIAQEIWI